MLKILSKSFPQTLALALMASFFAAPAALARGELSFHELDSNRDQKISPAEMTSMALERFVKADKNKDQQITLQEILNMMPFFVRDKARPKVAEYLKTRDLDGNGQVTLAEIRRFAGQRFKNADTNGDGFVDRQEFDRAKMNTP